ncbi:MAG: hypothetical protein JKY42_02020 [Flavobacteriales bacterium]|nr:hypothetical protein [Flavobacteriales bacterium]
MGNNITVGRNITFDLTYGIIELLDWVDLTHHIQLRGPLKIGNGVLIAENVYIGKGEENQLTTIGDDVWLGAGCLIENGSNIPKGVVIGAKCKIKTSDILSKYGVYVGNPVKLVKYR